VLFRSMLHGENTVTLFGMYTSTIPGAFLIGPPFAEWYLSNYGSEGYFLISAVPGLLSVLLLLGVWMQNRDLREDYKVTARYREVLSKSTSWLPILCLILAGSIWGYVISFLPYVATTRQISGSLFIVASTTGLFASRFIVVDRLRRFDNATVAAWAICLMAVSLLVMGWVQSSVAIAICGFIFGLSYAHPLGESFAVAVNAKMVYERIDIYSDTAVAFDFFVTHKAVVDGLTFAASLTNVGGDMVLIEELLPMPTAMRIGAAFNPAWGDHSKLTLTADVLFPNDTNEKAHVGAEYRLVPELALRIGTRINYDNQGLTAGAGFRAGILGVDYAYGASKVDGFDDGHKFSINLVW